MGEGFFVIAIYILLLGYKMDIGTRLEQLYLKKIRYEHHQRNYERSLSSNIIPFGLRIDKVKPQIEPVSNDFLNQWNEILRNAEKNLVLLLYEETEKVIKSIKEVEKETMMQLKDIQVRKNMLNEIKEKNHYLLKKFKNTYTSKWKKFEGKSKPVRKFQRQYMKPAAPTVSDFVCQAIKDSKNITDNRSQRRKKREKYNVKENTEESKKDDNHSESILSDGDTSLLDILKDLQRDYIPPAKPVVNISTHGQSDDTNTGDRNNTAEQCNDDLLMNRENTPEGVKVLENGRLKGYFASDTVFNLSHKVLSDCEISILSKGLGFSPQHFL